MGIEHSCICLSVEPLQISSHSYGAVYGGSYDAYLLLSHSCHGAVDGELYDACFHISLLSGGLNDALSWMRCHAMSRLTDAQRIEPIFHTLSLCYLLLFKMH